MNNAMKRVVVGLSCIWATSLFGCSSSDGAAPVPLEKLPQEFASALCESIAPCCMADSIPYTATTCKSTVTGTLTEFVTRNTGAKYDAQAAGNCLSKLKSDLDRCVGFDDVSDCEGIFVKNFAIGERCTSSSDCASHHCEFGVDAASSLCAAPLADNKQHGRAGEACLGDCSTLDDGLLSCGGFSSEGATAYCYESEGLYCDFQTSVCKARAALGASCTDTACVAGTYCDPTTLVCSEPHDSGTCYFTSSTQNGCSAKSYCSGAGVGGAGQCVAKKPDGYSCTTPDECFSKRCNDAGTCGVGPAATEDSCRGYLL